MATDTDKPADESNELEGPVSPDGRRYKARKAQPKPEPSEPPPNVAKPLQNSNPGRTDFPEALTVEPDEVDVEPPPPRRYYWCGLTPDAPMDEVRCGGATFRKRGGIPLRDETNGRWLSWLPTVGTIQRMSVDAVEQTLWSLGRKGFEPLFDAASGELLACTVTRLRPGLECAASYVFMQDMGDEKPDPQSLVNAVAPPPLLKRSETATAAAS